ncbi:hypothetical protein MTR_3g060310 [Medicago truncatula]|uniref:Uncharacterized protein n=1 Tax=Medicago truncatula TaxID=3880 RepID=G7IV21_MEDTR|nr:hypothetical protein MTR_3g060310 [Medicago truncatula]
MWSGVPSYRSTLDRLTYANVELRPIPMVFGLGLFYPGGGVVDSLPCTILGSATKRLKESDLVVTQPSNNFGR